MYAVPHPANEAAAWLKANAPEGAVMLKEHWEEGLRGLEIYQHRELPMYNADTPEKVAQVATDLAEADYLHFYSSRLFGTIPRLPDDYPIPYNMTRAFYPLLFSGELGYELVHVEQKYPSLLGVSLVNDVFGRPGLTPPEGIDAFAPGGLRVHMGFADESFSVYDHPQVLVFENTGRRNVAQLLGILGPAARQDGPQFDPMLMPADEWERQQAGGTLRDITPPDGIGARWPLAVWLLAVYAGTLVTLPLGLVVFRALSRPWLPAGATAGAAAVDVRPLAPCEPRLDWVRTNEHCPGLPPDGADIRLAGLPLSRQPAELCATAMAPCSWRRRPSSSPRSWHSSSCAPQTRTCGTPTWAARSPWTSPT